VRRGGAEAASAEGDLNGGEDARGDRRGQGGGAEQGHPAGEVELGDALLLHGGHVGEEGRAGGGADGDDLGAAGAHVRGGAGGAGPAQRQVAGDDVGHQLAAGAVGDVGRVDAQAARQLLADEARQRLGAAGGERGRVGAGMGGEAGDVVEGQGGAAARTMVLRVSMATGAKSRMGS
jgi:hypothetical protein